MFNTVIILTDFEDFYTLQMIGKILLITQAHQKNLQIQIQIRTLKVKNYSITEASFLISQVSKFFENAIFVCVVDPGVGTKRRTVIIEQGKNLFVGPDNGIFSMLNEGIERVVEIEEDKFSNACKTFHGRDIFAVIAGEILNGKDITEFGKTDASRKIKMSDLKNKILYIDNFGNIITSIRNESVKFKVGEEVKLKIKGRKISARFVETFADEKEKFIVYCGSSGFIEIGKFMDNTGEILKVKVGDKIEIENKTKSF